MADSQWSESQQRRLKELGINLADHPTSFETVKKRNSYFQQIEKKRVKEEKTKLTSFLQSGESVALEALSIRLTEVLSKEGFTRVSTPAVISKSALKKMTVDENHPLNEQIFWLNNNQCLRPMLAPNLYSIMADLCKTKQRPIRFFEIGSCFRKESDGARHNEEFTMLNLVEIGTPEEQRLDRLKELATLIVETANISPFHFEEEDSVVYGQTLDVISSETELEIASGAMGQHPLDLAWNVDETWVGLGFGLERLLMAAVGETSIARWGKSLSYLNGIRLKL